MRVVSEDTTDAWKSRFKGGQEFRPIVRATIQPMDVKLYPYSYERADDTTRSGQFATMLFGQRATPIELPNVKSAHWSRDVDQDVATCTMELWNTQPLPLGEAPTADTEFDQPGFYSPDRGNAASASEWGYQPNGWQNMIVPDRIIRTFEGYGFSPEDSPEDDEHLYLTGVWLIDDVDYPSDQIIRVRCRDMGRELVESIGFPPVVPFDEYPMIWEPFGSKEIPVDEAASTDGVIPGYQTDSGQAYVGLGLADGDRPYIGSDGSVRGHHGSHAFDGDPKTFWMSVGNDPGWSSAFEWVQAQMNPQDVAAISIKAWGGPYRVYVSVWSDGSWKGRHKIPYRARSVNAGTKIKYVKSKRVRKNKTTVIKLKKTYGNVTKIRVTFKASFNSQIGRYRYRAGAYEISAGSSVTTPASPPSSAVGNYADLLDIVKWVLAWGGFYWPGDAFQTDTNGDTVTYAPPSEVPVYGKPQVWGDFEATGTTAATQLGAAAFDKKPLMDVIAQIRDIVQYLFFVDEAGGTVFRSPNIWRPGNYLSGVDGGPNTGHTTDVITIDDTETLLNSTITLSSRSRRDKIFIANTDGNIGAVANGYNPYPSGTRRVAGWADQGFASERECQIMADLIALRILFRYRQGTITIPGNPALQIDDQIELKERVSAHSYRHYVQSIDSTLDMADGRWTYNMKTSWLGTAAEWPDGWAFNASDMSEETQAYLRTLGKI